MHFIGLQKKKKKKNLREIKAHITNSLDQNKIQREKNNTLSKLNRTNSLYLRHHAYDELLESYSISLLFQIK
ncbi:hypothetical protein Syun_019692 [Stephania yunnanensis]|uniref:Uncharacterized protein n=1 Tax=Stephania yunnanensis TaxID=152371 RepID=A0AAP0IVA9_9MAGN